MVLKFHEIKIIEFVKVEMSLQVARHGKAAQIVEVVPQETDRRF